MLCVQPHFGGGTCPDPRRPPQHAVLPGFVCTRPMLCCMFCVDGMVRVALMVGLVALAFLVQPHDHGVRGAQALVHGGGATGIVSGGATDHDPGRSHQLAIAPVRQCVRVCRWRVLAWCWLGSIAAVTEIPLQQ
jgi:hypothetical protein